MSEALAVAAPKRRPFPLSLTFLRTSAPSLREIGLATFSAVLVSLSFPNFDLWWLAWIGLVPLLVAIGKTSRNRRAFLLGLIWGIVFYYGTCWWLTYSMIRYGEVRPWLAYPLLLLPVIFVALFPALACAFISRLITRFGIGAILAAPLLWVSFDWLRAAVTGLIWNSLGYSQAFHPVFIQPAHWGGVYAITFLILTTNTALSHALLGRRVLIPAAVMVAVIVIVGFEPITNRWRIDSGAAAAVIIAVQPNVPMESNDLAGYAALTNRHVELTQQAITDWKTRARSFGGNSNIETPLLVIWPESPMNFSYSRDPKLQNVIGSLAHTNHASVLFNSLEPAPNGGWFNSAILVNEEGQKAAQYDKLRLMPFGEYVPLPRWLPGSGSVRTIVGEFTPGSSYTLMPLGDLRAGVFICIEAAHPLIARTFTNDGADVLINISNDGYLGPTAVMRQHLANAVFRAVENNRPLVRVTNAGISALIDANGAVSGETPGFQEAVRTWSVRKDPTGTTFYSRHGDLFAYGCDLITLGLISATFMTKRKRSASEARA